MSYIPSSPPLLAAPSPASSEPPMFSSDGPIGEADVVNYQSPRLKRKYRGAWWDGAAAESREQEVKKSKLTRNIDSGVWLLSDESTEEDSMSQGTIPSLDDEATVQRIIQDGVEKNRTTYDLQYRSLQDAHLHHLLMLKRVIKPPLDPGNEIPGSEYYRSMVPEIFLDLSSNILQRLSPSLFMVEHLVHLILRQNNIQELPPQINQLHHLRLLDVANNELKFLPPEILLLYRRNSGFQLNISGNPLLRRPPVTLGLRGFIDRPLRWGGPPTLQEAIDMFQACESSHRKNNRLDAAFWYVWLIRHLEAIAERDPNRLHRTFDSTWFEDVLLVASTPVAYYECSGKLVPGSAAIPKDIDSLQFLIKSVGSVKVEPFHWWEPPCRSGMRSLFDVSLAKTLSEVSVDEVYELCGGEVPAQVQFALEKAEENVACVYNLLRRCHVCGRDYVEKRAEWLEYWVVPNEEYLPVMKRVCSWRCVPDHIAKKGHNIRAI
ncbi:hypothetical protein CC78DRAFT_586237 [Lojkania enalia]|uniref:Uncharacterized protein n=1 Tax=Lojkania enalia TaxID=147567 RepID=A0A9P4JXX1_9PLEO|nr:hypothetical protein CC78DRAFT_586237 [Didymosphaeria enalia]